MICLRHDLRLTAHLNSRKMTKGTIKNLLSRRDVDMTSGNVYGLLIRFAVPLLLGNLFQQLYNTVDTWVVGNYVGKEAFSAVGTVTPILNMLIGFFMGLSTGAGVVISQYYGAKQEEKVSDTVHTALVMTAILGVLFTAIGVGMTPLMLRFMKTPAEVFSEARTYLTIYFSGIFGLMLYNMGAGILRAVGDSQRPFYFLVLSASLNIVLDLLFVLAFHMGVAGVAYATILSQGISAVLVMIVLVRADNWCKVHLRKLKLHWAVLKKIVRVGIPAAIQMAITAFSNVFVQSYINFFGADCMGGWTAYAKIDAFLFLPMQSVSMGATTFVGQNLGMNDVPRARQGVGAALKISALITVCLMAPVVAFAPHLVRFFNDSPEVVRFGTLFLRLMSPFYVLCCVNQILAGSLRGAGDSRAPMFIMLFSFVLFRQIYLYLMTHFVANTIVVVALGYPAGWLVCSTVTYLYFRFAHWEKHRIVE